AVTVLVEGLARGDRELVAAGAAEVAPLVGRVIKNLQRAGHLLGAVAGSASEANMNSLTLEQRAVGIIEVHHQADVRHRFIACDIEAIIAAAAVKRVVTGAAKELVIAVATVDCVVALVAGDLIVAVVAVDRVVAAVA